jgi:hypothetical protein
MTRKKKKFSEVDHAAFDQRLFSADGYHHFVSTLTGITATERDYLNAIAEFHKSYGSCNAGNDHMAKRLHRTSRTIKRAKKRLSEIGLINVCRGGRRPDTITINRLQPQMLMIAKPRLVNLPFSVSQVLLELYWGDEWLMETVPASYIDRFLAEKKAGKKVCYHVETDLDWAEVDLQKLAENPDLDIPKRNSQSTSDDSALLVNRVPNVTLNNKSINKHVKGDIWGLETLPGCAGSGRPSGRGEEQESLDPLDGGLYTVPEIETMTRRRNSSSGGLGDRAKEAETSEAAKRRNKRNSAAPKVSPTKKPKTAMASEDQFQNMYVRLAARWGARKNQAVTVTGTAKDAKLLALLFDKVCSTVGRLSRTEFREFCEAYIDNLGAISKELDNKKLIHVGWSVPYIYRAFDQIIPAWEAYVPASYLERANAPVLTGNITHAIQQAGESYWELWPASYPSIPDVVRHALEDALTGSERITGYMIKNTLVLNQEQPQEVREALSEFLDLLEPEEETTEDGMSLESLLAEYDTESEKPVDKSDDLDHNDWADVDDSFLL